MAEGWEGFWRCLSCGYAQATNTPRWKCPACGGRRFTTEYLDVEQEP